MSTHDYGTAILGDQRNQFFVILFVPCNPLALTRFHTIILPVQTLEDQPELLLMVSEIMNKLLEV